MFGFVYIQITKSYESLQSEHSLEYMPKTWTEVDEGECRKECDAASQTASTMAPGPSSTSCNAALNGGTCAGQHHSTPATSRGPSAASTTSHTDAARVASNGPLHWHHALMPSGPQVMKHHALTPPDLQMTKRAHM